MEPLAVEAGGPLLRAVECQHMPTFERSFGWIRFE
jgi:hypothetical protein